MKILGAQILVVDDQPVNQAVLAFRLRKMGAEVIVASSGPQALKILDSLRVDLIFLDIQMPQMDGFEVLRRIREKDATVPVIAWTCSIDKSRICFSEYGFSAWLDKPLDTLKLHGVLGRFLSGRKNPRVTLLEEQREIIAVELEMQSREMISVIVSFGRQLPARVSEISLALESGALESAAFASRALRGSGKLLGYEHLAEALKALEAALLEGDGQEARTILSMLLAISNTRTGKSEVV